MGGHGGLNILPQKRWHLYRRDNRERVARDERRAREEAEGGRREANRQRLDDAISGLRQREEADEATTEGTPGQGAVQQTHDGREVAREYAGGRDKDGESSVNVGGEQKSHLSESSCFNLFEVEEKEYKKHLAAHKKYLEEVGHDGKNDESAFNSCKALESPWYTRALPSMTRFEAHIADSARTAEQDATTKDTGTKDALLIQGSNGSRSRGNDGGESGVLEGWASTRCEDQGISNEGDSGKRTESEGKEVKRDRTRNPRHRNRTSREDAHDTSDTNTGAGSENDTSSPSSPVSLKHGKREPSRSSKRKRREKDRSVDQKERKKQRHHRDVRDEKRSSSCANGGDAGVLQRLRLERLEREAQEKKKRLELYRKNL